MHLFMRLRFHSADPYLLHLPRCFPRCSSKCNFYSLAITPQHDHHDCHTWHSTGLFCCCRVVSVLPKSIACVFPLFRYVLKSTQLIERLIVLYGTKDWLLDWCEWSSIIWVLNVTQWQIGLADRGYLRHIKDTWDNLFDNNTAILKPNDIRTHIHWGALKENFLRTCKIVYSTHETMTNTTNNIWEVVSVFACSFVDETSLKQKDCQISRNFFSQY